MKVNIYAAAGLTLALMTGVTVHADGAIDRLQIDQKLTGRASPDYYSSIHAHSAYNEAPGGSGIALSRRIWRYGRFESHPAATFL